MRLVHGFVIPPEAGLRVGADLAYDAMCDQVEASIAEGRGIELWAPNPGELPVCYFTFHVRDGAVSVFAMVQSLGLPFQEMFHDPAKWLDWLLKTGYVEPSAQELAALRRQLRDHAPRPPLPPS